MLVLCVKRQYACVYVNVCRLHVVITHQLRCHSRGDFTYRLSNGRAHARALTHDGEVEVAIDLTGDVLHHAAIVAGVSHLSRHDLQPSPAVQQPAQQRVRRTSMLTWRHHCQLLAQYCTIRTLYVVILGYKIAKFVTFPFLPAPLLPFPIFSLPLPPGKTTNL